MYRQYALMRVKAAFREDKSLTDPAAIAERVAAGHKNLEVIKRQVCFFLVIYHCLSFLHF